MVLATKADMSPVPLAARPIGEVALFTQVNTVPDTGPVKVTAVVVDPLHTVWLAGTGSTVGVGFTVITYVVTGPTQPAAVGVMETVAKIGTTPVLVAVKAGMVPGMLPVPLAPKPTAVLLFVQAKVVPATGPVTAVEGAPSVLQYIWSAIASTVGVGLTVIV